MAFHPAIRRIAKLCLVPARLQSHPKGGWAPADVLAYTVGGNFYWAPFSFGFLPPGFAAGVSPQPGTDANTIVARVTININMWDQLGEASGFYPMSGVPEGSSTFLMQAVTLIHELGHIYDLAWDRGVSVFGGSVLRDDYLLPSDATDVSRRRQSFINSSLNTDLVYDNCVASYFKGRGVTGVGSVGYRPGFWGNIFDATLN
jgi:hypothetical protein